MRPLGMGSFEFVIVSSLRAAQLTRGCSPRVVASHTNIVTAQLEVADGKVTAVAKDQTSGHNPDA